MRSPNKDGLNHFNVASPARQLTQVHDYPALSTPGWSHVQPVPSVPPALTRRRLETTGAVNGCCSNEFKSPNNRTAVSFQIANSQQDT